MIARILIPLIVLIALPDLYLHWHYLNKRKGYTSLWRVVYWMPAVLMLAYTFVLASVRGFAPEKTERLFVYLLLLGILVVPKVVFALCSFIGLLFCRLLRKRQNWGNLIGLVLALFSVIIVLYGSFIGSRRLVVRQEEFSSKMLPPAFDGYKIVHFSDAHVGSYLGNTRFMEKVVNAINEQQADAVMFTGDLQNMLPSELDCMQSVLSSVSAKDGVWSVLGNHDYSFYAKADFATEALNESLLRSKERSMGWKLLLNEHQTIRRGGDTLVIAGMEDSGKSPFPQKGDMGKTVSGIQKGAFVIMLQHDPTAWRREILPHSDAQLTLSGHTHGGQLKLFGWSPASVAYDEWGGMYHEGHRALNVSTGIGGFVPFRFGVPPEIVVITLRAEK